jgi:hypothetical protein
VKVWLRKYRELCVCVCVCVCVRGGGDAVGDTIVQDRIPMLRISYAVSSGGSVGSGAWLASVVPS